MGRHNNTEQLGINAVNTIVSEEMDWIYRPVPPPDVGIDGTIEQKINGDPTAKFIAVQLKTGLSHFNFNRKKNKLTYRASLIHYNYWLSSNIPVILVAHIPEWKSSYWQLIDKSKFKQLRKSWQLDIPLNNKLCKNSIKDFNQILLKQNKAESNSGYKRSIYDYIEDSRLLSEATRRTKTITELLVLTTSRVNNLTTSLNEFNENQLSYGRPKIDSEISTAGRHFHQLSREFILNIEIFAESYGLGISALSKLIRESIETNGEFADLEQTQVRIEGLSKGINASLDSMSRFYMTLKNMVKLNNKLYDEGIEALRLSIGQIVSELGIAYEMTIKFNNELKEI